MPTGRLEPSKIVTQHGRLTSAVEAYKHFDAHEDGWLKVVLEAA
jgi:threonine dehydrogenase-like Zn-dependent dehydrogenase